MNYGLKKTKTKTMKKKSVLVAVIVAFTMSSETIRHVPKTVPEIDKHVKLIEKEEIVDSTVLTKELLVEYIQKLDIPHPEIAYSIACLESGLISDLCKSNNNLFGMKQPGVRPTTSLGRKRGFASFKTWYHSVDDYKLFLEFTNGHKKSREEYLNYLDQSYAHPGYTKHLAKFFDEYHEIKNLKNKK